MNQKGFSLIEVTFSIAIITISLVSIISLFSNNIKSEIKSRNKLIAVYLANESIEIVRQQRDNNWFGEVGWMTDIPVGNVIVGLNDDNDIRKGWEVVVSNVNRKKIYLFNSSYVQLKSAAPIGWEETGFERYLTIDTGTAGCFGAGAECMEVTSYVSFKGVQSAEITAYFYDGWY